MQKIRLYFYSKTIATVSLLLISLSGFAQIKNSPDSFFLSSKKKWIKMLIQSISVNTPPPVDSVTIALKNISPFIVYRGLPIRRVLVEKVDYGQSINDTSSINKNFFNDLAKKLHKNTKEETIRNNLFFKEKEAIQPYLIADNETYLRTIPYLQDARITIRDVYDALSNTDSADVIVLYKDVFPIGGNIVSEDGKNLFVETQDDNMWGRGDRLQVRSLFDLERSPKMGYGAEYLMRNIKSSFINGTIGYQNLNPTFNTGLREENTIYSKFEMPLVSPHRLWTGSAEASIHYTNNTYSSDSLFNSDYNYRYNYLDGWIGYNISAKEKFNETFFRKEKEFLGIRVIRKKFIERPSKFANQYNYMYADQTSILGTYTIFKQEYYHTSYIYGFGRNEDVPEGYTFSLISGWTDKQSLIRPYAGIDIEKNYFSTQKNYLNITLKAGSYFYKGNFQDMSFLASIESFTRLRKLGNSNWLLRHFISGSFTQQINNNLNQPLLLNSAYGLQDFINQDTTGSSRATINYQSAFYNTWKFFGFNFAPFSFGNMTYLKPIGKSFSKGSIYTELGAGVRSRNENLIFGTMELKVSYYPLTTPGMSTWNISFNTNLQYKYISQFIKRPDFVTVN